MSRAYAALIGSAVLLTAGPALAGPCEQLAGGRWTFYLEGRSPAHVETGVMDFRDGVTGGVIFKTSGPLPLPPGALATPFPHGSSTWIRAGACLNQPGNVARLGFPLAMDVTVAADGRSAGMSGAIGGGQGLVTGWAAREPARAFTQQPRN